MNCAIFLQPETPHTSVTQTYSIRGKCTADFFATTVNQFYNNYGAFIASKDTDAILLADDDEWTTTFEAPLAFYAQFFNGGERYTITEVPRCYCSGTAANGNIATGNGTRVLNLLTKIVAHVSYRPQQN
jgi:hypothetical protein